MAGFGKILIAVGVILVVAGIAVTLAGRIPYLGRLPGDIVWKRGNFRFYFPLATSLLVSAAATLILYLIARFTPRR
jgi:hypothetical protein